MYVEKCKKENTLQVEGAIVFNSSAKIGGTVNLSLRFAETETAKIQRELQEKRERLKSEVKTAKEALIKKENEEKIAFKDEIRFKVNELSQPKPGYDLEYEKKLEKIMTPYFVRFNKEGADILPKNNRNSGENITTVDEIKIHLASKRYIMILSSSIMYVDTRNAVNKNIELKGVSKKDIRKNEDGSSVHYIKNGVYIPLIKNGKLKGVECMGLDWEDKDLCDKDGYDTMNITAENRSFNIKVHQLYHTLELGAAVVSTTIWSGASIFNTDHILSDEKRNNRDDNLRIIRQTDNAANTNERYLLQDCSKYLKAIAARVEKYMKGEDIKE